MNDLQIGIIIGLTKTIIGHPLDTIKTNIQNSIKCNQYNIFNIYNGVTYPLVSTLIINANLFHFNHMIKKRTDSHYISGFITGIICSPLINCFEVYKINYQIGNRISNKKFIKYLNKGIIATCCKESIGTSIYFGSYNFFKSKNYNSFISGGLSGMLSWLFTYPFDTIKTRIQSGDCNNWSSSIKKGNLMSGIGICLIRSGIINSFSFTIYDYLHV